MPSTTQSSLSTLSHSVPTTPTGKTIISVLYVRDDRLREVKQSAKCHNASKCQTSGLNTVLQAQCLCSGCIHILPRNDSTPTSNIRHFMQHKLMQWRYLRLITSYSDFLLSFQ